MSGARDDRPGLAALLDYVREGDTVVVWKLDRLGRNTLHILETVKALTECGVTLVSVTDGIDSSTAAGRMMIGVLGALAEYERELTKERTALKRQTSRAKGTKFGRPRKVANAEHARLLPQLCAALTQAALTDPGGRDPRQRVGDQPVLAADLPTDAPPKCYVATTEQVWALYDAVPDHLRAAVLLGAFTGLRV